MDTYTITVSSFPDVYNVTVSSPLDFTHGGTMNGNLVITGSISASEYLNLPADTDTLNSVTTRGNTTSNTISVSGLSSSYIQFNTSSTPLANSEGLMQWNDTDGTLNVGLKGGNVTLQVGQEEVIRVVNKTGANLLESEYKVARIRLQSEGGAQGQRLAIVLAQSDSEIDSATTIGIVTENIDNNQEGFITTFGQVRNIDTTGTLQGETWLDGDMLYLSPLSAGFLTKTKPQAPQHSVVMGYVVHAHQNQGSIFVKVDNGYELDELHNVKITSPQNNDVLKYNSLSGIWENGSSSSDYLPLSGGTVTGSLSAQSLSASSANIQNGLIVDTNTFVVDSVNNRVGIGTAIPTGTLEIKSSGSSTPLIINKTSESGVRETLLKANVSDNANNSFFIANGSVSNGAFAPIFGGYSDSTSLWPIGFSAYTSAAGDASDSSSFGLIDIGGFRTDNITSPHNGNISNVVNRKLLTIRNGPFAGDVKLTVAASGNVGIGTSSPSYKLDVSGTFNTSGNTTIGGTLITTGKITANGQGALSELSNNDVLTKQLGDSAYATTYIGALSAQFNSDVNTTTYKNVPDLSFTLPVGNYYIDCILIHNGNASYATSGVKDRINFTGTATATGTLYRILDNATTASSVVNALASRNPMIESAPGNRSQVTWRKGKITVTSPGTLSVQIAQTNAIPGANTTLDTGSFLSITKCNN